MHKTPALSMARRERLIREALGGENRTEDPGYRKEIRNERVKADSDRLTLPTSKASECRVGYNLV